VTEFKVVTDLDLLQATLFNRSRLLANGCWEWMRGKRAGYGQLQVGKKKTNAHRASYEAFTGEIIPEGMVIRHTCDNPSCINPDHLVIGTMADNMADREARGRRDVKGEQIGTSKLTERDVLAIRASTLASGLLAKKYGVHSTNIWAIRAGKSWRHLNAAATAGENDGR
jgi:hypothetical protein